MDFWFNEFRRALLISSQPHSGHEVHALHHTGDLGIQIILIDHANLKARADRNFSLIQIQSSHGSFYFSQYGDNLPFMRELNLLMKC